MTQGSILLPLLASRSAGCSSSCAARSRSGSKAVSSIGGFDPVKILGCRSHFQVKGGEIICGSDTDPFVRRDVPITARVTRGPS